MLKFFESESEENKDQTNYENLVNETTNQQTKSDYYCLIDVAAGILGSDLRHFLRGFMNCFAKTFRQSDNISPARGDSAL